MNKKAVTANTRIERRQPFAWWEKNVTRVLRKKYPSRKFAALKNVYLSLCELESDFHGRSIQHFGQTLATYSGISRQQASQNLTELKQLGLVSVEQIKEKGIFTQSSILTINRCQVQTTTATSLPLSGQTVDGSTRHILEESIVLEETLSKDKGRVSTKLSCPLDVSVFTKSPISNKVWVPTQLQVRYPNGHTECVEYLTSEEEDRSSKFINRSKQFSMIHKILRAGYDFTSMDKTIRQVEKKYGKGGWDYATLASWLEKGSANG